MIVIKDIEKFEFDSVNVDPFWNIGNEKEHLMHRIHSYPAKFPAFIASKAFHFAKERNTKVRKVADIFCGCGTTAFEASKMGIEFWGCDINPVATMIAKAKSLSYQSNKIKAYFDKIKEVYSLTESPIRFSAADQRLQYWYRPNQLKDLLRLKIAIEQVIPPNSRYRLFFLCAFSNILKAASQWLTKSIKPQLHPQKKPNKVFSLFAEQYSFMILANEKREISTNSKVEIHTGNFLDYTIGIPKVDLIVTSPPYVNSYEYADLHQLSTLWLNYANDYRDLREGSIGSLHHNYNFNSEWKNLNRVGSKIVSKLIYHKNHQMKSVAKYFLDMQKVAHRSFEILKKQGLAFFVIGNTEYKGVRIDNALHLAESLIDAGFSQVLASKRKISNKILRAGLKTIY